MSGEVLLQSTSVDVTFSAYLASDHVSAATGKTIAITISKNKAAFGNPSAGATNATEIASGVYYVNLSTTDTGTLGPLVLRGAVATIDDVIVHYRVREATNMGLTALPTTAVATNGSLITSGTGTSQISLTSGQVILQTGTGTGQLSFASGILKVDVDTIKTNPVANGGTITFPTNATLASTTNITAGTISTATAVTTVNGLAANVITATSIAADAITAAKVADGAIDAATFAAGAINAAAIADGAIDNATFAADVGSTAIATNIIGIAAQKGVVNALNVDTYAEPGQGAPAATTTLVQKIGFLYKAWRNKTTQTATETDLYADDASTVDQKAAVSDDATTFTKGEFASGP